MTVDDEPAPDLGDDEIQSDGAVAPPPVVEALQQLELVFPGASQQGADEAVFGPEQEQKHPRAGSDGRRQRPQRDVGEPVVQNVAIGELEELLAA